ncbi:TRAP transporter small permease [Ruegeria arenilitoris]|nr:TRAP transporter small permease [Ruegeria arenilitoris]UWR09081.1 TRAP transporter small permease [Ruegeria sp. B32]
MGALILLPILAVIGTKTVQPAAMEYEGTTAMDRFALFIGRVTMMMIAIMTVVMLYEVFMRYILEKPTEWANEMTLWFASFVFLMSGYYAMQQRSHIRIFLLYDAVPRWLQRVFDTISTILIVMFAFFLVYGSYQQVFVNKLYKWELYGSAFNPPIPATLQPMVLIVITLVAMQAVLNLIADWNKEPEIHTDEPDEDEIEMIKRAVGQD